MYLIVGLGNPEPQYCKTRHNMGFDVINKISKKYKILLNKKKFNAMYGIGVIEDQKVVLIKPQTFMNLSGEALRKFVKFYKIEKENILVIYDDMDTDVGKIRVRSKGGAGSHNGMKSILEELDTEDFPRIRIGIGKPENEFDRINYVIGNLSEVEYEKLQKGIEKAVDATISYLTYGIETTMNKFNI